LDSTVRLHAQFVCGKIFKNMYGVKNYSFMNIKTFWEEDFFS